MAYHRHRRRQPILPPPRNHWLSGLGGAAVLLSLLLHGPLARADSQLSCATRLPSGACIGPSTLNQDGEITIGTRGPAGPDALVWAGTLTHQDRLGIRTECSFAPHGNCEGILRTFYPDRRSTVEHLQIRDGIDEHYGVTMTLYPDGRRLECVVNPEGECEGETVLQLASKEILHGTRRVVDGVSQWTGIGRWRFPSGEIKDCLVAEDGDCRMGPIMFWDGDTKRVGTLGPDNLLVGKLTIFDRSGLQKSCAAAQQGSCRVSDLLVRKAPRGAWEKPAPRRSFTKRPWEILASRSTRVEVVISAEGEQAQFGYQLLACGDDIRIAYWLVSAPRTRIPFKGQVWNGPDRVGEFDDPAAVKIPVAAASCRNAQFRTLATLKNHQSDLVQHRFIDGSDLWSQEQMIRNYLDRLTIRALPVIAADTPKPKPVPIPSPGT